MSLNVSTALYKQMGIDTQSVQNVSNKILQKAQEQSQSREVKVVGLDYSKFNRASLGVDLYSAKTTPELQKQIALYQAGLYSQVVNVAKLNAQAAANLYSASTVQRNVELTQSVAQNAEIENTVKAEENQNVVKLYNTQDKNPNSQNGFNPFTQNNTESGEAAATVAKEENEEDINIFDFAI